MSAFRNELARLVAGFRVVSPSAFSLYDRVYSVTPAEPHDPTPVDDPARLQERLSEVLYRHLHCRMGQEVWAASIPDDQRRTREFVNQLSQANPGVGPFEHGWLVREVHADGGLLAERQGVCFAIPAGGYSVDPPGRDGLASVKQGQAVLVHVPKEKRNILPGFYLALGNTDVSVDVSQTTRVYWHVRASGAAPLIAALTRALNATGTPFWLKLVNVPDAYVRSDAAVLYVPRSHYGDAEPAIASACAEVAPHLRTSTSAFVKRLAAGLGVAEDPGGGSSFGQHRSRIVAAALLGHPVLEDSVAGAAAAVEAVSAHLTQAGLDPDAVHLSPGSTMDYRTLGAAAA